MYKTRSSCQPRVRLAMMGPTRGSTHRGEKREAEVVHNLVGVVVPVRGDLHAHGEAFQAQVKVLAHRTLHAWDTGDVLLAVVAVVQGPALRVGAGLSL